MTSITRDMLLLAIYGVVGALSTAIGTVMIQNVGATEAGRTILLVGFLLVGSMPFFMASLCRDWIDFEYWAPGLHSVVAVYYLHEYLRYSGVAELSASMNGSLREFIVLFLAASVLQAILSTPRVGESLERRLGATEMFN